MTLSFWIVIQIVTNQTTKNNKEPKGSFSFKLFQKNEYNINEKNISNTDTYFYNISLYGGGFFYDKLSRKT